MSKGGSPKIALVHDELIRRGGAEIVFEELIRIFPEADVYSLYAGGLTIEVDGISKRIETSFLQKFPKWFRRHPGRILPFLGQAAEQFDFADYDLVLSSSSAFAKALVTRVNVPHVCYCHTPTRYLWERPSANPFLHYLKMIDYAAAQRVDVWLANSNYTQARIQKYYGSDSEVVYPPIDTAFFYPKRREREYFLCVGRLSPAKHFEQAVSVCEKLRLPLKVVGNARVPREELRELYRGARALIQPGVEDFGMASAEAMACGTPVIAVNAGGVKEIVKNYQHGVLYENQSVEGLAEGIRQFLEIEERFLPESLQKQALQFASGLFRGAVEKHIAQALEARNT